MRAGRNGIQSDGPVQGRTFLTPEFPLRDQSGAINLNWLNGISQRLRATGNLTITNVNAVPGSWLTLAIVGDGTLRTLAITGATFAGGAPTMPTTDGDFILLEIYSNPDGTFIVFNGGEIFS